MADAITPSEASLRHVRQYLEQALTELNEIAVIDARAIAFASHAMDSYLTLTNGAVYLLKQRLRNHPDRQVIAWLDGLTHVTGFMAHTMQHFLHWRVSESPPLHFEAVDLPLAAERMCGFYQPMAVHKGITLHYDRLLDDIPTVWTDRVALGVIFDNILSNAVKYSPPGKTIWVQVYRNGQMAAFSVRDEGPGLSPEDQARLYQRGVTLTPRPTGGETSMGYGLAVAKELADQLGATLLCRSELGQGTTFAILLPTLESQKG
jgi:signal transduction histidine kinase